ncbi:MAG TPA: ferritin-like domain-containing protein [Solirubrobacteraceae bacterium]|nr:ferritin-like domain-containing protein [Solirubrobacteraceae bacterium]
MTLVGERVLWHFAEARTDTDLVRASVWLEQLAVLCYERGAGGLTGAERELAERFAGHERAHATAMETVLQGLTVTVRNRPVGEDVDWHLPGLGTGPRERTLEQLAELEGWMLAGYRDMVRRTTELAILRSAGGVMAGAAQHLAVLRDALGRPAAPSAFERGGGLPGRP